MEISDDLMSVFCVLGDARMMTKCSCLLVRPLLSEARTYSEQPLASRASLVAPSIPTGPAGSRSLEVLIVAVNQASDTRQWYTATNELQLASLQLCKACRGARTLPLRVDDNTPPTLLADMDGPHPNPEKRVSSRVPRLRARRVTWDLPSLDLLIDAIDTFAEVEQLRFGDSFNGSLDIRAWPCRLRVLTFGIWSHFNQPVVGFVWPASIQQLRFGCHFNQPIQGTEWPISMQQLTFIMGFNQPVEEVVWPRFLQQLDFGQSFNQPIEKAAWPKSLRTLVVGNAFNQPVQGVAWPESLRQLEFGGSFNQPVEGATWPPLLQKLRFGFNFNQPIKRGVFPSSLLQLNFGQFFNQPIEGVTWPPSLQ